MPTRASQGFTLLEILIAMAIFTLIGLASNAVLSSVLDSDEASSARFAKLERLQRAMIFIERDMLQVVARPIRVEGSDNQVVISGGEDLFESEADGIGLVRAGWSNPQYMLPRSTLQALAYRLQDQQLQKLYNHYVDNVQGSEPKVVVLLEGVEDFRVQFFVAGQTRTRSSNGDTKGWQDTYTGTTLPEAIAVEITLTDFGTIRREWPIAAALASRTGA